MSRRGAAHLACCRCRCTELSKVTVTSRASRDRGNVEPPRLELQAEKPTPRSRWMRWCHRADVGGAKSPRSRRRACGEAVYGAYGAWTTTYKALDAAKTLAVITSWRASRRWRRRRDCSPQDRRHADCGWKTRSRWTWSHLAAGRVGEGGCGPDQDDGLRHRPLTAMFAPPHGRRRKVNFEPTVAPCDRDGERPAVSDR